MIAFILSIVLSLMPMQAEPVQVSDRMATVILESHKVTFMGTAGEHYTYRPRRDPRGNPTVLMLEWWPAVAAGEISGKPCPINKFETTFSPRYIKSKEMFGWDTIEEYLEPDGSIPDYLSVRIKQHRGGPVVEFPGTAEPVEYDECY